MSDIIINKDEKILPNTFKLEFGTIEELISFLNKIGCVQTASHLQTYSSVLGCVENGW